MSFSSVMELVFEDFVFRPEKSESSAVKIGYFTGQNWRGLFTSISEINSCFSGREEKYLHKAEFDVYVNIRAKSYRESWLAGRLLTKILYKMQPIPEQNADWKDIQIVSRNPLGQSRPPRLLIDGMDTGFIFSLSHVVDRAIVVIPGRSAEGAEGIGCDLVYQNTTTPGIVKTFFHDTEINDHQDNHSFDAIWAVKEAAYKSCNDDEAFQPRQWLTQRIGASRYFCRHLDLRQQLFAEAEIFILDEYTLAVARKTNIRPMS